MDGREGTILSVRSVVVCRSTVVVVRHVAVFTSSCQLLITLLDPTDTSW